MTNREKFNDFVRDLLNKYEAWSDEEFVKNVLHRYFPYGALFKEYAMVMYGPYENDVGILEWLRQEAKN